MPFVRRMLVVWALGSSFGTASALANGIDCGPALAEALSGPSLGADAIDAVLNAGGSFAERAQKLSALVRTPEDARNAAARVARMGASAAEILDALIEQSPHFRGARRVDGTATLVTHSFEKETRHAAVADLFRPLDIDEAAWFAKPLEERVRILERSYVNKVPTSRRPAYLSPELSIDNQKTLEIKHASYEISLPRTVGQMREVAARFGGEEAGFHLHIVFELPADYPAEKMRALRHWVKQLNDYVFLRGLENRLHPNDRTMLPALSDFPENLRAVLDQGSKFFGVGFRGEIYGPASDASMLRVGVELRDSGHGLGELSELAERSSDSVALRVWESPAYVESTSRTLVLRPTVEGDELWKKGIALAEAAGLGDPGIVYFGRILKGVPGAFLPLEAFEEGAYASLAGSLRLNASQRSRLRLARAKYEKDFQDLAREFKARLGDRRFVTEEEKDLTETAVRWNLNAWARSAQLSEFYRGF